MLCNKTWSDWPDPRIGLGNRKKWRLCCRHSCPGYNETALTEGAIENISQKTICFKDDTCNQLLRNNPQKRFIQPEDIVNTVII